MPKRTSRCCPSQTPLLPKVHGSCRSLFFCLNACQGVAHSRHLYSPRCMSQSPPFFFVRMHVKALLVQDTSIPQAAWVKSKPSFFCPNARQGATRSEHLYSPPRCMGQVGSLLFLSKHTSKHCSFEIPLLPKVHESGRSSSFFVLTHVKALLVQNTSTPPQGAWVKAEPSFFARTHVKVLLVQDNSTPQGA